MVLKKLFKGVFLLVILGVPVVWYLFLQAFGENKFHLDTLGYVSPDCELSNALVFCNDRELSIPQRNQENRVKRYLSSIDFNYIVDQEISSCLEEHYAKPFFLLVARDAAVKGVYEVTMEDVDRLVTEVDLLMTLRKDENTK